MNGLLKIFVMRNQPKLRDWIHMKYLRQKKAVCGGFSRLYKAMLNLAGIPAVTIAGNTPYGAHEWNLVYADKEWFYSDSTWGASSMDYFHKNIRRFF